MTIKDLQRMVLGSDSGNGNTAQSEAAIQILLQKLRDKKFWIWNSKKGIGKEHLSKYNASDGNDCFNHIIGLPKKNGKEHPFYHYELMMFNALFTPSYLNSRPPTPEERKKYERISREVELKTSSKHENIQVAQALAQKQMNDELIYNFKTKHVFCKKATALGITELILRIMVWLCVRNDDLKNTHMCLVCGPRIEIAQEYVARIRRLMEPHGITLGGSMTSLNINGVTITCYPSNHLDSMRGLDKVSFIFLDEADFFPKHEQENARTISERYIAKSDPFIVLVSTPNRPDGLFAQIEKELYESCIYKKLFLDYTYGLGGIYTEEEIEKAKRSPSFPREYELQYQGLIGNVFSPLAIENCQKISYDPTAVIANCKVSIGIDPSFGSSKFGIVATRFVNERIEVIEAEEYERPDFNDMLNVIWQIKQRHNVDDNNLTCYVDAANPEIWSSLKRMFKEPHREQYVFEKLAYYKKNKLNPANYMKVIPIPFSTSGAKMLQHTKSLLEDPEDLILIDKRFDRLLTALRTAVANEYKLDKEATSFHDILDAFRLSLQLYQRSNK